jgi:hemerythrin
MVLFEWGSEFCVGVGEIDAQHRRIVDLINQLHEAMLAGSSEKLLEQVFQETVYYARFHFKWEEALMTTHAYPDLALQQAEHAHFAARVQEFQARFAAGDGRLSLDAVLFLVDWLAEHIQGLDAVLGRYLNGKGIH